MAEGTEDQSIYYERSVHGLTNPRTETHIKRVNIRPRTFHFIRFINFGGSNIIIDKKKLFYYSRIYKQFSFLSK
jgi:hypothetical protein